MLGLIAIFVALVAVAVAYQYAEFVKVAAFHEGFRAGRVTNPGTMPAVRDPHRTVQIRRARARP